MSEIFSEKKFILWVTQYTKELVSWAYHKTSDLQTAEDLVQDTFLVAAEKMNSFRNESNPKTWLYGILNNKIADFYKTKAKHVSFNFDSDEILHAMFDEHGHWKKESVPLEWNLHEHHLLDDEEFLTVFNLCMKKLLPQWHLCITSKYLQEKSAEEVCQELGISSTNYWQIMHRAKLQVRKCLEVKWFYQKNAG